MPILKTLLYHLQFWRYDVSKIIIDNYELQSSSIFDRILGLWGNGSVREFGSCGFGGRGRRTVLGSGLRKITIKLLSDIYLTINAENKLKKTESGSDEGLLTSVQPDPLIDYV